MLRFNEREFYNLKNKKRDELRSDVDGELIMRIEDEMDDLQEDIEGKCCQILCPLHNIQFFSYAQICSMTRVISATTIR